MVSIHHAQLPFTLTTDVVTFGPTPLDFELHPSPVERRTLPLHACLRIVAVVAVVAVVVVVFIVVAVINIIIIAVTMRVAGAGATSGEAAGAGATSGEAAGAGATACSTPGCCSMSWPSSLTHAALSPFRVVPLKCLNAIDFISPMVIRVRSPPLTFSLATAAGAASMSLDVST